MAEAELSLIPGAFLVDIIIPISKYVSEWFPGTNSREKLP